MATCSSGPAVGSKSAIHVGQEECWGILVRPTHLIEFTNETIQATENTIQSNSIRADRAVHKLIQGTFDVAGDINAELNAAGLGILIYNALGGYLKLEDTTAGGGASDAGKHARLQVGSVEIHADAASGGTTDLDRDAFIELAPESNSEFDNTTPLSDRFAVIYKAGLAKTLTFDDNVGAGYDYYSFGGREVSVIASIAAVAADPIHGVAGCTPITLAQVYNSNGVLVDPDVNLNGGVVYLGAQRVRLNYLAAVKTGSGTTLYLQPSTLTASGYTPAVNDAAIVAATLACPSSTITPTEMAKGSWVVQWYRGGGAVDYTNVWSHYFEADEDLPEGLTIEVDRDKAIFTYVGMKVNSMTVDFPSQEVATVAFNFLGRQEYAIGVLDEDVHPGETAIDVKKADHFSDPQQFPVGSQIGYARVGEEEFTYTTLTDNGDGTWTLSGIPASGDGSIGRTHLKKSNVDLMSSLTLEGIDVTPVIQGQKSPLTAFETMLALDGYFEEVLSGNITFNNNLNGDKFGLGSQYRFGIVAEQRTVEASLNVEFDDGKLYKKFKEGEFFALEFKCVSLADGSEIDNTEIFHQMHFFLPKCKFTGSTPNVADTSYIQHDMPATCIFDDAYNTAELCIFVVNSLENDAIA